jgi:uncharacterized protein YbjQ (UPF0145 family)
MTRSLEEIVMRVTSYTAAVIALVLGSAWPAVAGQSPPTITVYDSTQIALDRYVVVKRIGIQEWASAFRIRSHASLEAARQALANEAARSGADGLINVTCFDQTDRIFKPAGYYCYGNAIKVKQ